MNHQDKRPKRISSPCFTNPMSQQMPSGSSPPPSPPPYPSSSPPSPPLPPSFLSHLLHSFLPSFLEFKLLFSSTNFVHHLPLSLSPPIHHFWLLQWQLTTHQDHPLSFTGTNYTSFTSISSHHLKLTSKINEKKKKLKNVYQ